MNTTKIVTIICWLVVAVVLIGFVVWFFTGSLFGLKTGFQPPDFHIGTFEDLTGPFEEAGTYTVEAENVDNIRVDWVSGAVEIVPYDGSEIRMTEYARRALNEDEPLVYDVSGGTLNIRYVGKTILFNMLTKKLEVFVPRALAQELDDLYVDTTSAEITVSDFLVKTLDINTTSGRVSLSNIGADMVKADSTSGAIHINDLETDTLTLDAVSGALRLEGVTADTVRTDTTSGAQYLEGSFNVLNLDSVSGAINVVSAVDPDRIVGDTTSGAISVTIPGDTDLTVSHSTVSGRFSSEVPVISDSGSAPYQFDTVSGDIQILKAS